MLCEGSLGSEVPAERGMAPRMSVRFPKRRIAAFVIATALLSNAHLARAQRGGGAHVEKPSICLYDCTNIQGRSSQDDLKTFHRAMELQATDEQRAAFAKVMQHTQAAIDKEQSFLDALRKTPGLPLLPERSAVDQAVEQARASNQNFLESLSSLQKSGLKETTKKLQQADADLDKEIKALDQVVLAPKPENEQASVAGTALGTALASFQTEQFALGGEMSIALSPTSQDVAFTLPATTNSFDVDGQGVSFKTAGVVTRTTTPTTDGNSLFGLKFTVDLSDLQQNITRVIRASATQSPVCGERIEIRDATLTPLSPASLALVHLHYERWVCGLGRGNGAAEVAAADGAIEIKLTPAIEANTGLRLTHEINRVEADGFLKNLLRSGDLGITLSDQIAASLLSILQKEADAKAALPAVARPLTTVQTAQFQDLGADQMAFVESGQIHFSDEQAKQFAAQLKQPLSAPLSAQGATQQ